MTMASQAALVILTAWPERMSAWPQLRTRVSVMVPKITSHCLIAFLTTAFFEAG